MDYAGRTVPIYGAHGEEAFRAHVFVGAMGASGCAYAEATRSESLPDWLASHVRAPTMFSTAKSLFGKGLLIDRAVNSCSNVLNLPV